MIICQEDVTIINAYVLIKIGPKHAENHGIEREMRNSIINEDFKPSVLAYGWTITDTKKCE